jgi:hypothetical protein
MQGFSVPLTPKGLSPLVSLPPWHYSSDCLVVEYWADPEAVTRATLAKFRDGSDTFDLRLAARVLDGSYWRDSVIGTAR